MAVFGRTTPYVVTRLTPQTGNAFAPAYYVVVAAVASLLAVLTLRETAGRALAPIETDEMFQSAGQTAGSASSR